ncbi:CAMK protein kinase [Polytolypa hystricis UAMH7299]|uniref:CAMK protein kinase n=1 Tax=Polytolypa hystricis (strain UAMH7299) TaxID=1447883 RepID=A0A2B7XFJ5_POLH7|nr:CAMK protein kinase [Polytolypa hystricis UAMH7299]
MEGFSPTSHDHVGVLYESNSRLGTRRSINVYASEELIVGRHAGSCHLMVDDPVVSNKHLRIYTIIFDQGNPGEVAPLIYAQDLSSNGTFWNGALIGKGNGGFLLSDGDTLSISEDTSLTLKCQHEKDDPPFGQIQLDEIAKFHQDYSITNRLLGAGAYGKVHMAVDHSRGKQLACKIVDIGGLKKRLGDLRSCVRKTRRPAAEVDMHAETQGLGKWGERCRETRYIESKLEVYNREVDILKHLHHPNIIGLEKVFRTENTIYMFQELVTAGDLFSFLEFKQGKLLDVEAAVIVRQIVIALDYLHANGIVHRDLKPDNVLMTSLENGSRVVLTDFGCARYIGHLTTRMTTMMGTVEYTAPEIRRTESTRKRGYTKAVDMWSLGCLTVVLLTGGSPFTDPNTLEYSEEMAFNCNLDALEMDKEWQQVGERPKDFVRKLLVQDPERRMIAKGALIHGWFANPVHYQAFHEVYTRSVKGWDPRPDPRTIVSNLVDGDFRLEDEAKLKAQGFDHSAPAYRPCLPFANNFHHTIMRSQSPGVGHRSGSRTTHSGSTKRRPDNRKKERKSQTRETNSASLRLLDDQRKRNKDYKRRMTKLDAVKRARKKRVEEWAATNENPDDKQNEEANMTNRNIENGVDPTGDDHLFEDISSYGYNPKRGKSRVRLPFSPRAWDQGLYYLVSAELAAVFETQQQQGAMGEWGSFYDGSSTASTPVLVATPQELMLDVEPMDTLEPGMEISTLRPPPPPSPANGDAEASSLPNQLSFGDVDGWLSRINIDPDPDQDLNPDACPAEPASERRRGNGRRRVKDIFDFEEDTEEEEEADQVYEEVEDRISGKKRMVVYGEDADVVAGTEMDVDVDDEYINGPISYVTLDEFLGL